jgi:hypothetical protein
MSVPPEDPFAPPPDDDPARRRPDGAGSQQLPGSIGPPPGYSPFPAPKQERQFSVLWVVFGALTPVLLVLLALAGLAVILPVVLFGPVVAGALLIGRGGTPQWRGYGLGLLIGWGVLLVVGAGLCVAILGSGNF